MISLRGVGAFLLLCAAGVGSAPAQTFTVLANLTDATGDYPLFGALVQGIDGNLYGTTSGGGALQVGAVIKITPTGQLTTFASFGGSQHQTNSPVGGLLEDQDGNFFGTLSSSVPYSDGAVFFVTPAGEVTYPLFFDGKNGAFPQCTLVQAADRSIYGTTTGGGASGNVDGEVFKLTAAPSFSVLHGFGGIGQGVGGPIAGVIQATDGNFYGTTSYGGSNNDGTVFKISPGGEFTVLHSFDGTDGSEPTGALVQAADGNLYGTTGGVTASSIFKISTMGQFTLLYSFGFTEGGPMSALIQATDGNLYGTSEFGDAVFKIDVAGGFTIVHTFDGATGGAVPTGGLMQATDGSFYGTTTFGGTCCGTVFRLDTGLGPFVRTIPVSGPVDGEVTILGTDLTGTTGVSFNGAPATFTLVSPTQIRAHVPVGATSGKIQVTTPGGTLESDLRFRILP